nr:transporter substrate-binding domain-containing protein [uncultured Pseudodesulfovibrio sp.]
MWHKIFIWLFLFVIIYTQATAGQPRRISLATLELAPYVVCDTKQNPSGTCIHIVQCTLKKMGIELSLHVVPWARAQSMALHGEVDGFFPASQTPERDVFATQSAPFNDHKLFWYVRKDYLRDPTAPTFPTEAKCACFRGTNAERWMEKNGYTISYKARDYPNLINVLLENRVDAILANNGSMDEIVKKQHAEDKIQRIHLMDAPLGVYFTKDFLKKHQGFLEDFNQYTEECRIF